MHMSLAGAQFAGRPKTTINRMDSYITFTRFRGGRFQVLPVPCRRMHRFVQTSEEDPEAGGALIGRYISGTGDVVVDEITVPLPSDEQARKTFHRTQASHQQKIEMAWMDSGHTQRYLGEWHTHPEAVLVPSELDRLNWTEKLSRDRFGESLFFLIVGTERIRAWEGRPDTGVKNLAGKEQLPSLQ